MVIYKFIGVSIIFQFILFSTFGAGKINNPTFYISVPATFPKETLEDIRFLMQEATGKSWMISENPNPANGIILKYNKTINYPTIESSRINSNGSSQVMLEAYGNEGLTFGIYKYLRTLGFKFYLPGENYTIIPQIKNPFLIKPSMITPFQQIRNFFGTGGFGSGKTDLDNSVQKDWQLWQNRNGFGQAFSVDGHVGETFNLDNASMLQKNPGWTATPLMKNGNVDVTTKLNYLDPAAVDYFTDWVIRKYRNPAYNPPPTYFTDMVSIEPADGGSYKTGTAVIKDISLKTPSDQVFFAANEAGKKLDKLFPKHPNIGVNLYAYSGHADVPSFPLHKRVFVQLVPYQFQNISFGPAFIKRWSSVTRNFGLYDYFRYPDANWDIPTGLTLDELMKRAVYAYQQGSKGTTYETSYSKFTTGIPLWVLIRFMADGETNWEKNYNQLIGDLYGNSSEAVKNIFNAFYRNPGFDLPQLQEALYYANQAENAKNNNLVKNRLAELDLYLLYIQTYFHSRDEKNGSLEQRNMAVYNLAWSLYEKKILHSYRIMQLVSYGFLNAKTTDAKLAARYKALHLNTFTETNEKNPFWKVNLPANPEKLLNMAQKGRKDFTRKPALPESISIEKQFEIAHASLAPSKKLTIQGNYYARGYFNVFSKKETKITINWSIENEKDKDPFLTIAGVDKNYKAIYDFPLKGKNGNLNITIPAGTTSFFVHASSYTTYKLSIQLNGALAYFEPSPRGKMAFLDKTEKNSYYPAFYPSYVYVPKGTKEIIYKVQLNALKIFTPGGQQVSTKLLSTEHGGFETRSFNPPTNETGKFWKMEISNNYNYEMLNIPDVYFLMQPK